jgi:hypothetical protein
MCSKWEAENIFLSPASTIRVASSQAQCNIRAPYAASSYIFNAEQICVEYIQRGWGYSGYSSSTKTRSTWNGHWHEVRYRLYRGPVTRAGCWPLFLTSETSKIFLCPGWNSLSWVFDPRRPLSRLDCLYYHRHYACASPPCPETRRDVSYNHQICRVMEDPVAVDHHRQVN